MQWWGALTQQFTQLAANAMQEGATDSARNLAGNLVKQGLDAAGETFRQAAAMPVAVAKTAGAAAQKLGGRGSPAPAAPAARQPAAKKKPAARRRVATKPR